MTCETIYKDAQRIVKIVKREGDELFYTRTYILDDNGHVDKDIIVFYDGTVSALK
jgi:hypothetical protein